MTDTPFDSGATAGTDADANGDGDALSADRRERLAAFAGRHGFLSWLGVDVETVEHGRVVLSIPADATATLRNPDSGTVHGGVAATLIDTASGFALRTTFAEPAEASLTTTDLNVSYLRPATAELVAEAEVRRAGGSMGVADVTVTSTADAGTGSGADDTDTDADAETEVAAGRATYRLFREES